MSVNTLKENDLEIKANVVLYTTPWCPFCNRAKTLLSNKGVSFKDINVDGNPSLRQEMMAKANGRHTVPQIFINGQGIGGSDDLHALDAAGKLDPMLAKAPA
jgi:glutaredoxin 3